MVASFGEFPTAMEVMGLSDVVETAKDATVSREGQYASPRGTPAGRDI